MADTIFGLEDGGGVFLKSCDAGDSSPASASGMIGNKACLEALKHLLARPG